LDRPIICNRSSMNMESMELINTDRVVIGNDERSFPQEMRASLRNPSHAPLRRS
jgi:hypothetical protein